MGDSKVGDRKVGDGRVGDSKVGDGRQQAGPARHGGQGGRPARISLAQPIASLRKCTGRRAQDGAAPCICRSCLLRARGLLGAGVRAPPWQAGRSEHVQRELKARAAAAWPGLALPGSAATAAAGQREPCYSVQSRQPGRAAALPGRLVSEPGSRGRRHPGLGLAPWRISFGGSFCVFCSNHQGLACSALHCCCLEGETRGQRGARGGAGAAPARQRVFTLDWCLGGCTRTPCMHARAHMHALCATINKTQHEHIPCMHTAP